MIIWGNMFDLILYSNPLILWYYIFTSLEQVTNYVQGEAVASERSYLRNIGSSSNNEESRKLEDEMGLEGVGVFAGTLRLVGILIFAPVWITFKMVEGVGDVINITQEQMVAAYDFYFRTVIASIIGGSD